MKHCDMYIQVHTNVYLMISEALWSRVLLGKDENLRKMQFYFE